MPAPNPSVCITCGLDAGPSNRLNRLKDGRVCPTCSARLMESLPPLFPGFGHLTTTRVHRLRAVTSAAPAPGAEPATPSKARRGPKRRTR